MSLARSLVSVDAGGLRLPPVDELVDVLFDGRRIFSVAPAKGAARARQVDWPAVLVPYLDGRAVVTLRRHGVAEPLFEEEVGFGSGQGRVAVVDAEGRALAVTKWGKLNHPFDATDRSAIEGYLDQVEEVLDVLRDDCGRPAFLSYGSLLGAVREQGLIGHDVDVDLGYLSAERHPADVTLESYRIERRLRAHGWKVRRENGGFLALFLPQKDGTTRNLDVFTCFQVEDHLMQVHDTRVKGDTSIIEPLRPVTFEGRELPGPARAEIMLEAAYGKGWRVPDPAFSFKTPRATRRRIIGWLGGIRDERDRWNDEYKGASRWSGEEPSGFARWALDRGLSDPDGSATVVELGCGAGRDAVFLAEQGLRVEASDFAASALRRARRLARSQDVAVTFSNWNLNSLRESLARSALLVHSHPRRSVYARLVLDAISAHGRRHFWLASRILVQDGGRLYLEHRTAPSRSTLHQGGNVPGYLDSDLVEREAAANGLVVESAERGEVQVGDESVPVRRLVLSSSDRRG